MGLPETISAPLNAIFRHHGGHHTKEKWVVLYIERWLKALVVLPNGEVEEREQGTPQGGVASPLLANLFLHHVFDTWMERQIPE